MDIIEYQELCIREYKASIGYPESYTYLFGKTIKVQVPIETTINKIMIVGAYPSAKFFSVKRKDGTYVNDTPLDDNDSPFSDETYMDGPRTRRIPSGKELNEVILQKIGVERQDCWITDLVKVFLFKEGHIKKYIKLGKSDITPNRNLFDTYADQSLTWLHHEIEICNPYAIILLGVEVSCAVLKLDSISGKNALKGNVITRVLRGKERNFICLPHPGILMRKGQPGNDWPKDFEESISGTVKSEIKRLQSQNQSIITS